MANMKLPGYPNYIGPKRSSVFDHFGPPSYVAGGEQLLAKTNGFNSFDTVNPPSPAITLSATYSVAIYYPALGSGKAVAYVTLKWFVINTGFEVADGVDLSAESIRLHAHGG